MDPVGGYESGGEKCARKSAGLRLVDSSVTRGDQKGRERWRAARPFCSSWRVKPVDELPIGPRPITGPVMPLDELKLVSRRGRPRA